GLDVNVWVSTDNTTLIAAAPYLVDELHRAGIGVEIIYDSIAEFQQAVKRGDREARDIAAARARENPEPKRQIRVAVIDMQRLEQPQAGYAAWNGDHENFLMQSETFLAYLDNFVADDTPAAMQAHIEEAYTRHGARLVGFYTLEEFSKVAPRLFNGRSFP